MALVSTSVPSITFGPPFPTDFSPPDDCSAISKDFHGIIRVDASSTCLPSPYNTHSDFYFSPATACPSGYTAQESCSRLTDTTTTTLTCCPVRGDLTLSCIDSTATVEPAKLEMVCTWSAGDHETVVLATSAIGTRTSTEAVTMSGGEGINAHGIKMIYEARDLTTATATATATPSEADTTDPPTDTSHTESSSGGLSTGEKAAIGVVVPLFVMAVLAGAFVWYRGHRKRHGVAATSEKQNPHATGPTFGDIAHPGLSELYGDQRLPPHEMPAVSKPQELAAGTPPGRY